MRRALFIAWALACVRFCSYADVCSFDFSNGVVSVSMAVTVYSSGGAVLASVSVPAAAVDAGGVVPGVASVDVLSAPGPVLLEAVPSGAPSSSGRCLAQFVPGSRSLVRLDWAGVGSSVEVAVCPPVPVSVAGVDRWSWFWAGWVALFPVITFRWIFRVASRTTHAGASGEVICE